jgi:hypothetical protein
MYQAHTAGGSWLKLFVIAHIRNICNAIVDSHSEQRLVLISLDSLAIYG